MGYCFFDASLSITRLQAEHMITNVEFLHKEEDWRRFDWIGDEEIDE